MPGGVLKNYLFIKHTQKHPAGIIIFIKSLQLIYVKLNS